MKLTLGGQLAYHLPDHPRHLEVQLEAPARLEEILNGLGISVAEIYLVLVNGELVELQTTLVSQQDDVKLYPPVDGG